ncbi:hypothetical protein [Tessaracoccus caeni]|uniref:hypothetical protein n=1 Tax=Tessaracoccus caeni TaxID=3031239 RepID=UPI0023DA8598|nr:hypothetical protein [Tessaracoccus caeni]MDF1490347.1 hypothetical protein [Tessaracoccus caeni]
MATTPTINDILTRHLDAAVAGRAGLRKRRIEAADERLRAFLEEEGHRVLTSGDVALLELERQLNPDGAFVRIMHADDLVFALPGFVHLAFGWMPEDRVDRGVQVRFTDSLLTFVLTAGLVNTSQCSCPIIQAQRAISHARTALKREMAS